MKEIHIHLVSDSTGETVQSTARACLAQFQQDNFTLREHSWPLVRTPADLDRVAAGLQKTPGAVICTLVDEELRAGLFHICNAAALPVISILDPLLGFLSDYLGVKSRSQPGRQHILDSEYFSRIDAIQFAMAHDDGQALWNLAAASVVLVGVSRTSKTPTCIYLANRGVRAANVPFVAGAPVPAELTALKEASGKRPLVIGLFREADSLVDLRRNRLQMISSGNMAMSYADIDAVRQEVVACRRLCAEHGWPVLDTTRRSIEETAAMIIRMLEKHEAAALS